MRAFAPFSRLSRWLDRRIDARLAARQARQRDLPDGQLRLAEEAVADIRAAASLPVEGR